MIVRVFLLLQGVLAGFPIKFKNDETDYECLSSLECIKEHLARSTGKNRNNLFYKFYKKMNNPTFALNI